MGPILAVAGLVLVAGAVILGLRARERASRAAGAMRSTQAELEQRLQVVDAELGAMSSVLSSMEEGVLLLDASGRTRYANARDRPGRSARRSEGDLVRGSRVPCP
jgi:PAS domain-containing protein